MKITLINGGRNDNQLEIETVNKICGSLKEKNIDYVVNNLNNIKPKPCIGCDCCQNVNPGICAINDGINDILKQYLNSDMSIIITPIEFGGCNSITKNFIDRTEPLFLPYQVSKGGKSMMKPRYNRYPNIIFIGIMEAKDNDSIHNFNEMATSCNLSKASNRVIIKIITEKTDLHSFNEFKFIGKEM
ncbi:flavodoxin family protein [Clostridium autoethanogenum]|uniref:Flavodoxin family protein n=1 Tax=Clostridium autoethanogenum TaxID=84023 RepID=A0A3M0SV10_9CLOT|nr:flavodoxin family protein [Clostridium autoethanogenum]RMD02284.1 flavodoxin family protein [Clostridium autoethanogenum]